MRWSRDSNPSSGQRCSRCCCCCFSATFSGAATTTATTAPASSCLGRQRRRGGQGRRGGRGSLWSVLTCLLVIVLWPQYAGADAGKAVCGTVFTDPESSALLADVVLEGRVREKHPPSQTPGPYYGLYNVSIHVRNVRKEGKASLTTKGKRARLLVGPFSSTDSDSPQVVSHIGDDGLRVEAVRDADSTTDGNNSGRRRTGGRRGGKRRGGGGGSTKPDAKEDNAVEGADKRRPSDKDAAAAASNGDVITDDMFVVDCVGGDVTDGATYVFFLKEVEGSKGRYLRVSAPPVKKTRTVARHVTKVLKEASKPEIQKLTAPRKVTKGDNITVKCKAKAKPNPTFTWYLNGKEITNSKTTKIRNSNRHSRLKVNKVDSESSGVYTCTALNVVGEDSKNVTINVTQLKTSSVPCKNQTWCLNGGTCLFQTALQIEYCQCPKQWAGDRCELLDVSSVRFRNEVSREAKLLFDRTLIIVGLVIGLLVFVVICIASYFLAKRRQKKLLEKRRLRDSRKGKAAGNGDNSTETRGLLQYNYDQPDGVSTPIRAADRSGRPHVDKCTQTVEEMTRTDFHPHAHTSSNSNQPLDTDGPRQPNAVDNSQPINSDDFFRQLPPLNATATDRRCGSYQRPPRPISDKVTPTDLERRESRSRLKAVSVDDSCQDRPKSWNRSDAPDSKSMPAISDHGGDSSAEALEMEPDTARPPGNGDSSPGPTTNGRGVREEDYTPRYPLSSHHHDVTLPDFELLDAPIIMETPPKDNAHAQLKSSFDDDGASHTYPHTSPPNYKVVVPRMTPEGLPFSSDSFDEQKGDEPLTTTMNGMQHDYDEEAWASPLPPLYISEEDLNGNLPKRDSFQSAFLPPAAPAQLPARIPATVEEPLYSPYSMSPPLEQQLPAYTRPTDLDPARRQKEADYDVPRSSRTYRSGFSPRAKEETVSYPHHPFNSSSIGLDSEVSPSRGSYAYDPSLIHSPDSNDLNEQFMHSSPITSSQMARSKGDSGFLPTSLEDPQDYEKRMQNVMPDQEAIPI